MPAALGLLALLIVVPALLVSGAPPAHGQSGTPFNERDDQYRLLGLKRAQSAYQLAKDAHEREAGLVAEGVLPARSLDATRQLLNEAEVNFQQSLLAVVFEQQYVAVNAHAVRAASVQVDARRALGDRHE